MRLFVCEQKQIALMADEKLHMQIFHRLFAINCSEMRINMKLKDLLVDLEYKCISGTLDTEISFVANDSRKVTEGTLFICISGSVVDGHTFIDEVAKKGAVAVVVEKEVEVPQGVTTILVENTRYAMALISAAYFGHPSKDLKVIGITGTKGKTTTTYMVKSMLEAAGHKVGLIGTIEIMIGSTVIPAKNTTPESYDLQQYMRQMVDVGIDTVVMEVSSQGLMLHRTAGIQFDYGIFTNLSPDHIGPNEHKDFEDYAACKGMLFRQCKVGIVNQDDEHVSMVTKGHTCKLETFGIEKEADLQAKEVSLYREGNTLGVSFVLDGLLNYKVFVDIPGDFSVYNALTAIAIARHFEVEEEIVKKALRQIKVKGRVEMVPISDHFTLMIDYAHNAMSLESILTTLRKYEPKRLVCLFGCGGNRSKLRRYEMGEVSGKLADLTVITSDNPRTEEPQAIIDDIKVGMEKTKGEYVEICDRKEAIRYCIKNAKEGDIIVLAGKGHEDYQEINGVKHHMDERELIQDILKEEQLS